MRAPWPIWGGVSRAVRRGSLAAAAGASLAQAAAPGPSQADGAAAGPALLCRTAIASAESAWRIPDLFLSAIGRVESGRRLPASGLVAPWPWTIDAEGRGQFFASKAEAIAAVLALQARGVRSIDVGCLQVNLLQHPEAFASLEQAFDPAANAAFAARLLSGLFAQTGSWPRAAAAYHSQTPGLGAPYQQRVLAEWAEPDRPTIRPVPPVSVAGPMPARSVPAAAPSAGGPPALTAFAPPAREGGQAVGGMRGRDLAAYRRMPVALAVRLPRQPG